MKIKLQTIFTIIVITLVVLYPSWSSAQDPLFTQFFNKKSFYNPAAVGLDNSLAFRASYKSQWLTAGDPAYESALITIEDALPCSILDWGLSILSDREGAGRLSTLQAGIKLAATLPLVTKGKKGRKNEHNLRFGFDFSFGRRSVDFSKLTFSDNIDPKYGFINNTSFVIPGEGTSPSYFNPGGGIILQSIFDRNTSQSIATSIGFSMSNIFSLGGDGFGQTSSVLGIANNPPKRRYTAFGEFYLVPKQERFYITSFNPLFLFQYQSGIQYWEIGTGVNITPFFEVGIYTHNTEFVFNDKHTNWLSFTGSIMLKSSTYTRMELDFTFSTNYKGLQNQVGPIFEVGFTYHIARSFGCSLMGDSERVSYSPGQKCPRISRAKAKMYEDVWYRN
jgi:type IX secretion system PorP/SprF family membrane protein